MFILVHEYGIIFSVMILESADFIEPHHRGHVVEIRGHIGQVKSVSRSINTQCGAHTCFHGNSQIINGNQSSVDQYFIGRKYSR